jgi:hypothetical protein
MFLINKGDLHVLDRKNKPPLTAIIFFSTEVQGNIKPPMALQL